MMLAVRSTKYEVIKYKLLFLLGVRSINITSSNTNYSGISLLILNHTATITNNSIRKIEVL